jgi:hypothetical protein
MENVENFVFPVPETKVPEEKKKKVTKQIEDKRLRLPRTNRTVKCIFCKEDRILNPDQYQAYFDYWGNEDKIEREFVCKPCDVKQKENPIKFWVLHSNHDKLIHGLRTACDIYKNSGKSQSDVLNLQTMVTHYFNDVNIIGTNFEFILENQLPVAFKVTVPFVKERFQLNPYATTENRITTI